jgi:hypothetical protein
MLGPNPNGCNPVSGGREGSRGDGEAGRRRNKGTRALLQSKGAVLAWARPRGVVKAGGDGILCQAVEWKCRLQLSRGIVERDCRRARTLLAGHGLGPLVGF